VSKPVFVKVEFIRNTFIDGQLQEVGSVLELDEREARLLINTEKAKKYEAKEAPKKEAKDK
jgi:hypothetical protein